MTKEWPKELPPFEKMEEIFFKGAFDPDGDMYYDRKSGKKFWVDILAGTAEECVDQGLPVLDKMGDFLSRNFDFDGAYYVDRKTGKKYLIDIEKNTVEEYSHA